MKVTLAHVAAAAGVSVPTVSKVVNGRTDVAAATRSRVEALLAEPGDYALWPPGVAHRWRIEQDDTIVLTVRWPSLSADAVDAQR